MADVRAQTSICVCTLRLATPTCSFFHCASVYQVELLLQPSTEARTVLLLLLVLPPQVLLLLLTVLCYAAGCPRQACQLCVCRRLGHWQGAVPNTGTQHGELSDHTG